MATYDIGFGDGIFTGGEENDWFTTSSVRWTTEPTDHGYIYGGAGYDTIDLSAVSPTWFGVIQTGQNEYARAIRIGSQTVRIYDVEHIRLGNDNNYFDQLGGNFGTVDLGGGNDRAWFSGSTQLYLGDGEDYVDLLANGSERGAIYGGAGYDTIKLDTHSYFLRAVFSIDLAKGICDISYNYGSPYGSGHSIYMLDSVEHVVAVHGATVLGSDADEQFEVWGGELTSGVVFDGRGGADTLLGSIYDDRLLGGDGADFIAGGAGSDWIDGGAGNDTLSFADAEGAVSVRLAVRKPQNTVGSEMDTILNVENLIGSSYNDRLVGDKYANSLLGGTGNDVLNGGAGDDVLVGGIGRDILTGGNGADVFRFTPGDTTASRVGADRITDFVSGVDHIDVSAIDAFSASEQDNAFAFIGSRSFSGAGGELRQVFYKGNTFLVGDIDGDRAADFTVRLDGELSLQASDFVL